MPASFLIRRALTDDRSREPVRAGTEAPPFSLESLDGGTVSLEDYRGRPVVVFFWGSWCDLCRDMIPLLTEAADRHPDAAVVGVLFRDEPDTARAAAREAGAGWDTLLDPGEATATAWGVDSTPITFFVNRDGRVSGSVPGQLHRPLIDKQLARIL